MLGKVLLRDLRSMPVRASGACLEGPGPEVFRLKGVCAGKVRGWPVSQVYEKSRFTGEVDNGTMPITGSMIPRVGTVWIME